MTEAMRVRAVEQAGVTEVSILMKHEMENGLRKEAKDKIVPPHFIQNVLVKHKDKEVLSAQFGPAISKNPLLTCKFKGGVKGDRVSVTWLDNMGEKRSDETTIA